MDREILARVEKQAWFHRFPRGFPFLLFLLAAIGMAMAVIAIERADSARRKVELDRSLTEIASGIQRRATESAVVLRAGAALFETQDNVTSEQFSEFAAGMQHGEDGHGQLWLGWSRLVPLSRLAEFEVAMADNEDAEFLVHPRPAPGTLVTVPVVQVVPRLAANRSAIGFDMYSDPVRREAIDKAIRLDDAVATGKLFTGRSGDSDQDVGFIIYSPVRTSPTSSQIKGFVYSIFRARDFMESAVQLSSKREIDIALFDGPPDADHLLAQRDVAGVSGMTLERQISVANREWTLRVRDKRPSPLSMLSILTIFFGLVAGLLMMAIGRLMTKRSVEDREVLEWLSSQASIRDSLTRELNHRVKNTLANVLSIATLTRRRSTDLDDFSENFTGRIQALSATHDLLSETNWREAKLGEIVRSELAPYLKGDGAQAHISGPEIALAPNDAMSLGLAIHELATNAAKYGALTTPDGSIHVEWSQTQSNQAEIRWREEGGPPVVQPQRRGFGRDLIEKIVAHELGTQVELEFDPAGVRCTLHVPVRAAREFKLRGSKG
ncbi:MAG: CHASE domain-containing protein [Novosphingobium sp.]|nr:CHASE domain-containing protein [Novosphingobium sp.]